MLNQMLEQIAIPTCAGDDVILRYVNADGTRSEYIGDDTVGYAIHYDKDGNLIRETRYEYDAGGIMVAV